MHILGYEYLQKSKTFSQQQNQSAKNQHLIAAIALSCL